MFLNYDLLAKRWVPYSYVYPYAEGSGGILMAAGALTAVGARRARYRYDRRGVGVQGRLHRQA